MSAAMLKLRNADRPVLARIQHAPNTLLLIRQEERELYKGADLHLRGERQRSRVTSGPVAQCTEPRVSANWAEPGTLRPKWLHRLGNTRRPGV